MAEILNVSVQLFGAGTFTSPTFTVPSGIANVTATFVISPLDVIDQAKTMSFTLNRSDGSGGWIFDHGFSWQGGPNNLITGLARNPSIRVDVGPLDGQQCQVVMVLSKPMTCSILVTTS